MLLDWLMVGHVLDVNSAHAVRGPKHVVKKGLTPVLDRDEARGLIAANRRADEVSLDEYEWVGI